MKTPIIWKKLIINGQKLATTNEIKDFAKKVNKNEQNSLDYLQKHGYIYRILRGIFYIKSPEERDRGFFQHSIYEMVAMALKLKGVKHWYFALETALKFNEMTHEYFTVNFVITDSFRTTKIIKILNSNFQFFKWSEKHILIGIIKKNGLQISDKEKTVLDLAYKRYLKDKTISYISSVIQEYLDVLEPEKIKNYLTFYPPGFQKILEGFI